MTGKKVTSEIRTEYLTEQKSSDILEQGQLGAKARKFWRLDILRRLGEGVGLLDGYGYGRDIEDAKKLRPNTKGGD